MNWYFQYTPNDMWDYDEAGTHILFEREINGQKRKLITHSARNGFVYTMDGHNGQIIGAKPYMDNINWTKGIDQKTGKPLDYDPNKDVQTYSGVAAPTPNEPVKRLCPNRMGGANYWPTSYSPRTKLLYIPAMTACEEVTNNRDFAAREKGKGWFVRSGGGYRAPERYESNLTLVDPFTGEVKKNVHLRYPNFSGTLATGGGLVFLDDDGQERGHDFGPRLDVDTAKCKNPDRAITSGRGLRFGPTRCKTDALIWHAGCITTNHNGGRADNPGGMSEPEGDRSWPKACSTSSTASGGRACKSPTTSKPTAPWSRPSCPSSSASSPTSPARPRKPSSR
jgi:hypothetical protein